MQDDTYALQFLGGETEVGSDIFFSSQYSRAHFAKMVSLKSPSLVPVTRAEALLALGCLAVVLLAFLLVRQLVKQRRPPGFPPGPSPIPIIGNIFSLATEPHVFLKRQSEVHGQVRELPGALGAY